MLDIRATHEFVERHIPRSTFIGLAGRFAPWVGAMIVDVKQPILLIANEDQIEEAITRLSRVGFDNVLGYLEGSVEAWAASGKETDSIETVDAEAFASVLKSTPEAKVVDVEKTENSSLSTWTGRSTSRWNSWAATWTASPKTSPSTCTVWAATAA